MNPRRALLSQLSFLALHPFEQEGAQEAILETSNPFQFVTLSFSFGNQHRSCQFVVLIIRRQQAAPLRNEKACIDVIGEDHKRHDREIV